MSSFGKELGYPSCCTKWWANQKTSGDSPIQSFMNSDQLNCGCFGTGFIACPKCAKYVVDNKLNIESIFLNRSHQSTFPIVNPSDWERYGLNKEDWTKVGNRLYNIRTREFFKNKTKQND